MNRVKLYVGNIPYTADEHSLRQVFEEAGHQTSGVRIITDRETGQPRGFAFVEMATQQAAEAAIAGLDGQNYGGRAMRVSLARERSPGGGGSAGKGREGGGYSGGDRGRGGPGRGRRGDEPTQDYSEEDDKGRRRRGRY